MGWFLFALVALANQVFGQEETCLSGDGEAYQLFGTKTAYVFANNGIPTDKVHEILGCQPIAFWQLNRPGSHNPEAYEIEELKDLENFKNRIVDNYQNNNFRDTHQRICLADLNILELWKWNQRQNLTYAGDLTSEGYLTTQQIARAWKQRYPGLLTDNRHDYLFKYVNEKRSSTTFQAFTEGLFRTQASIYDIPKENNEKLLRPYKLCPAWTKDVEENNNTLSEVFKFESKSEFREMINNISRRLGFKYEIEKPFIYRMYEMCRYYRAWYVAADISPWCAAFTTEDLKRLEYVEDLKTYHKYGYGSELSPKIGCTLIKEMLDFFSQHIDSAIPQQPVSMIHFVEAPMFMMMLTAMGAHYDTVSLTGDNYHTNLVQNRKWTTSTMIPFNANLAAVLYKCQANGNSQVREQYEVLYLENEQPMVLPGCRVGLCDWPMIKDRFQDIGNKCDLGFCNGAERNSGIFAIMLAFVGFLKRYVEF